MAGYTRTISPQQWAKEMKALWGSGAAAGFAEVAERGLTEAGMRAIGLLQQRSDELAHDVGHFKRAWRSDVDGLRLTLHNTMPYSGVIEDGRRPDSRPPPSAALVPWVKRKLDIVPFGPYQKGRRRPNASKLAQGIAFVVARAIGRHGIKGKHVIGGVLDKIEEFITEEVGNALRERLGGGE